MMLRSLVAASVCASTWLDPIVAAADDLVGRLLSVPGLTIVSEDATQPGFRVFVLSFEQRVNHSVASKGTFPQRLLLRHRSLSAPMVVTTEGYSLADMAPRSEPAQMTDGNELRIEHRFFLPSRPDPADWRDLTIEQAAADHHRIIVALKQVYRGRWLTTGRSKGGQAAIYHRRFYPDDVDGTIAYVAPNDVIDHRDEYIAFLEQVGTAECRQKVSAFQREALVRRAEIVPMMQALADANGHTYVILGSAERALDLHVVDWSIGFWMHGGQEFCALIPPPSAPTEFIFAGLDAVLGFAFYTDQGIAPLVPAAYQAGTQIGYPTLPEDHLADLLLFPGEDVPRSFLPADIQMPRLDRAAMRDIDVFVRTFGSELMFIYGENDPATAEPFRRGPSTDDSFWYVVPGGNHMARIAGLPAARREEAMHTIRRWAGFTEESDAANAVQEEER
jgi:hypothetical protein